MLHECRPSCFKPSDPTKFPVFRVDAQSTNICETLLEPIMRDINEVLREKEAALAQINRELEALRIVAPLLTEESAQPMDLPKMEPERAESEPKFLRKRWP